MLSFLVFSYLVLVWFLLPYLCVVLCCLALCCLALCFLGLTCYVLSCPVLSCLILSCLVLAFVVTCCLMSYVVFSCLIFSGLVCLINPFPSSMNCKRLLCNMWGCCRFSCDPERDGKRCHSFATNQVKSEKNVIIGTKNIYDSYDSNYSHKALNKSSSPSTVLYRKDGSALSWKAKSIGHVNFSFSSELYTSAKLTPPSSFSSESYQP
jgi:hypothetical protein